GVLETRAEELRVVEEKVRAVDVLRLAAEERAAGAEGRVEEVAEEKAGEKVAGEAEREKEHAVAVDKAVQKAGEWEAEARRQEGLAAEFEEKAVTLLAKAERQEQRAAGWEKKAVALQVDAAAFAKTVEELRVSLHETRGELAESHDTVASLQANLQRASQLDSPQLQLAKAELVSLRDQVAELQHEQEHLRKSASDSQDKISELRKAASESQDEAVCAVALAAISELRKAASESQEEAVRAVALAAQLQEGALAVAAAHAAGEGAHAAELQETHAAGEGAHAAELQDAHVATAEGGRAAELQEVEVAATTAAANSQLHGARAAELQEVAGARAQEETRAVGATGAGHGSEARRVVRFFGQLGPLLDHLEAQADSLQGTLSEAGRRAPLQAGTVKTRGSEARGGGGAAAEGVVRERDALLKEVHKLQREVSDLQARRSEQGRPDEDLVDRLQDDAFVDRFQTECTSKTAQLSSMDKSLEILRSAVTEHETMEKVLMSELADHKATLNPEP
ncbi:hypothetical protein T484DRAFT_1793435, partial [Baffinella frigidus]